MNYIKFKGIVHERYEDAPFLGALLIANSCDFGCEDCFNKHLDDNHTIISNPIEIIDEVKKNVFNDGIILAGLEWGKQPEELKAIIKEAKRRDLKVIVYTGFTEEAFLMKVTEECLKGCYVKYGKFDNTKLVDNYKMFGVKLSSSNQYIKWYE